MAKKEINRRLYWFMLIVEMGKIESTGSHIEIMLIMEMAKIEINRRPYWIYAIYRDG